MNVELQLPCITDARGTLVFAEAEKHIPFPIKRFYFVTGTKTDQPRGFHAHKQLRQAAFCIQGSCKLLLDNGAEKIWITLSRPDQITLIEPLVWHELHEFSTDCIFLVLADDYYDENDYIRNYDEFIAYVKPANSPR